MSKPVTIQAELSSDEYDMLLLMLGAGTRRFIEINQGYAKQTIRVVNKLLAGNPDFTPYDEDSYNPTARIPFKKTETQ